MMVLTQLLLIFTVTTVAMGQERVCTYADQEDTRPTDAPDTEATANTLSECQSACDGDTECVALGYQAQGGSGVACRLYHSVPGTRPALLYTLSTQQSCSGEGPERECNYADQEDTGSAEPPNVSTPANTLAECQGACDGDTQCVALVYGAQGGSGVGCSLFYSVPGTQPAPVYTVSTQQTCSVEDACSESPCQNGGTCIGDAENDAFTCLCPFGFAGDTCQEECDFVCPSVTTCRNGKFELVDAEDGACPSFTCVEKDKPGKGKGFWRFKGLRRFRRHRWHG